jgi:hypothetical protein
MQNNFKGNNTLLMVPAYNVYSESGPAERLAGGGAIGQRGKESRGAFQ